MSRLFPTHEELMEEVEFYRDQLTKISELDEDIDYSENEVGLLLKAIDIAKDSLRKYGF